MHNRWHEHTLTFYASDARRAVRRANIKASAISDEDLAAVVKVVDADGEGSPERARARTHARTHTLARACMPAGRHALTKACQRRLGLYRAGRIPWLFTTRTRAGCQVPGVDLAQRRPAPRVRRQRNRPVGADRMRVQHGCSGDVCGLPGSLAPLYICVRGRGWHGRTLTWVINEPCNR